MSEDDKKFDPFGNSLSNNDVNGQTSLLGDSDLQRELLAAFKSELDEYLQALNSGLLRLEQGEASEQIIQEIFRSAHSMKGTSGAFGLTKIQKVSHALENLFGAVRSKRFFMDKLAFDLCYEGLDIISKLMEMELAGQETPHMVEVNFAQSIEILLNAGNTTNTDPLANQATQARQAPNTADLINNSKAPGKPFIVGDITDAEIEQDTQTGKKLTDSSKLQQSNQVVIPPQAQEIIPQYSQSNDIGMSQTSLLGDSDLQGELLAAFKSELDEYLQALNSGLLRLEQGESSEQLIQEIFRSAHSMKGTSGAFGLTKIQKVSHALENLFGAVRSKKFVLDKLAFDLCYEGLDTINKLMEMELAGQETPPMVEVNFAQYVETLLNAGNIPSPSPSSSPINNTPAPGRPFIVGDITDAEIEEETQIGKKLTDSSKLQNPNPPQPVITTYQTIEAEVIIPEYVPVDTSASNQTALLGDSDLQRELLAAFKSELDEYLQALNSGLLRLEQGEASEQIIQEIFRSAHSMKGTSGAFGLTKIQKVSHALENLFGAVRSKKFVLDKLAFDLCYEGLDTINKLVEMELAGIETPHLVEVKFAERIETLLNKPVTPVVVATPAPPVQVQAVVPQVVQAAVPQVVQAAQVAQPIQAVQVVSNNQSLQKNDNSNIARPSEQSQDLKPLETAQPAISNNNKPTVLQTKESQTIMKDEKGPLVSQAKTEFIRIPLVKIDHLMSDVGELIITRSRYEQRVKELEDMNVELLLVLKEMLRARTVRRKMGKIASKVPELEKIFGNLDICETKLKNINGILQTHTEDVSNDDLHLELIVSSIQREVQGLRMLPIETLFEPLRRRVRDISRHQDKTVTLELQGGETELDRQLIEAMRDPLVHLITNSIDHGLETPDQRKQAGKNPTGSLRLSAGQRGNQIIIEITDDGRGIDFEKVKQKAISVGLFTERELASFTEDEIVSLIFRAGFSTKAAVTEFSGRGVGLDVVKVNVEKLQGQIDVHTVRGKGSTFKITLPLTLSTQRVLLVKAASQLFALPVNAIDRLMSISVNDVFTVGAKMTIAIEGKPISLIHLSSLLNVADTDLEAKQEHVVMVLAMGSERAAFVVDEALGEQEVVVKALGKPLRKMKNIAGGAILGDGSVMLLLNPSDLLRAAKGSSRIDMKFLKKEEKGKSKSKILVIDDSITTRTLEKNILEMAGFEVLLAKDGMEGLEMSRTAGCNLILSDIDMPKLNGIDLTTEIKNDPKLKHLPVVLISSLDTPEIKTKVAQSGADAFIVKGQFDQHQFLQVVKSMLSV